MYMLSLWFEMLCKYTEHDRTMALPVGPSIESQGRSFRSHRSQPMVAGAGPVSLGALAFITGASVWHQTWRAIVELSSAVPPVSPGWQISAVRKGDHVP